MVEAFFPNEVIFKKINNHPNTYIAYMYFPLQIKLLTIFAQVFI